jgi:hypothetical protein
MLLVPSIVSIDLTRNSVPNVQPISPNSQVHTELVQKLLTQVVSQQGSQIVNLLDLSDITIDGGEL